MKTNGVGSIILAFPYIYNMLGWDTNEDINIRYKEYLSVVKRLEGKIDWSRDEIIASGTGKKIMAAMRDKIISLLKNNV